MANDERAASTPSPEHSGTDGLPWPLLAALADGRGDGGLEARQRLRMRRFGMALLTAMLTSAVLVCFVFAGQLPWTAWLTFTGCATLFAAGFAWLIRSGLNLRFPDPSLTIPMMAAALSTLLYVMWRATDGHALISLLYVLPFVFGTLRLDTLRLLVLAVVTLAADLAIAMLSESRMRATDAPTLELLRWVTLAIVLMWFSFMGGFLSALRHRVDEANRRLAQAVETIRHMATHDELTGVWNRRQLVELLRAEAARSARYGTRWCVCLVDLDYFKRVNDTLGHAAGDRVLSGVAQAIDRAKRPTDAFGRWGGEEFLLVLAQTRAVPARLAGERLRQLVEAASFADLDPALRITVSMGVAEHDPGEPWQSTLERADRALYQAKGRGRNRVELLLSTGSSGTSAATTATDGPAAASSAATWTVAAQAPATQAPERAPV